MGAEFVHLHVHSQYSFLTSTLKIPELVEGVKAQGMSAVALTDHANMFGAVRFYKECQHAGIAPILGAELNVVRPGCAGRVDHLVVLAASLEGYRNLVRVVTRSYTAPGSDEAPSVTLDQVAECAAGLVVLTGCLNGVVAQAVLEGGVDRAEPTLAALRDRFEAGRLFVELQDHGFPEQRVLNGALVAAAARLDLPVVATNDVHFAAAEDGEAHIYLDCIRKNTSYADERAAHHGSFAMYLKSPEAMAASFRGVPGALKNSLLVAEMCAGWKLQLGTPMLPHFPVPEGYDTNGYLAHLADEGLARRLGQLGRLGRRVDEATYRQRLASELEVILKMHYAGYFLIVWDFIREAKSRGIPVGPGRGSGAGSLVAYSLGITDLDPLAYDLIFERFLNPERVSMPDFDVDFCMARRDEVIGYVAERYGAASVGQIATYQNLKARSVIKDVARTMGIPHTEAQRYANLVPDLGQGKTATIGEALEQEPRLAELVAGDPRVAELIKQARKLEGLPRHAGTHAAGVVISDGPLEDQVPCFTSDGAIVTQYDKEAVEDAGLVKFDFLGLKTLTTIAVAERLVNARPDRRDQPLHLADVPLDDADTYALISSGETRNVFQLESAGMQREVLRPLKPDTFEDIVAAVALYRPGPLGTGMIPDYIDTKHGRKPMRRLHPLVDEVLAPTYGVPVYQEQVMQIAQRLAGYSLGGADLLRRAMGKKKASEMEKQRETFVAGAAAKGVSEEQARAIFEEIRGFAEYGFNKSHSAAYAVLTYQTAYLKAHYPAEFFAAVMTTDKDKIEKVVRTIAEARAWGVNVLPPDINMSEIDFTVVLQHPGGDGPARGPGRLRDRLGPQIRFGLGAVRGVGEAALEHVFEARRAGGPFRDLFDFAARVDARRLNRALLEALVQCGAFDSTLESLQVSRARSLAAVERALERSRSTTRDRERGQTSMFGLLAGAAPTAGGGGAEEYPRVAEWDQTELLRREKAALGCYVSGHPVLRYGGALGRLGVVSTVDLASKEPWSEVAMAGMVEAYKERTFKGPNGGKAAFFELEDLSGRVEAQLRGDKLIGECAAVLSAGEPVLVRGDVRAPSGSSGTEGEPSLRVTSVEPLAAALLAVARRLVLRLDAAEATREALQEVAALVAAAPGPCALEVVLRLEDGAEVDLAVDAHRVRPTEELLAALERRFGRVVADLR